MEGASRIDRLYQYGDLETMEAEYFPLAFSDHLGHFVKYSFQGETNLAEQPKSKALFKIPPHVAEDVEFGHRVRNAVAKWTEIKARYHHNVIDWWELLVKPGINRIAKTRLKEINKSRKGILNVLLLRQVHLNRSIREGNLHKISDLEEVHKRMMSWYEEEAKKLLVQINMNEITEADSVNIHHYEIHQKRNVKSDILKLETEEGVIEGHGDCSNFLINQTAAVMEIDTILDVNSQNYLLNFVEKSFTDADNEILRAPPTLDEV